MYKVLIYNDKNGLKGTYSSTPNLCVAIRDAKTFIDNVIGTAEIIDTMTHMSVSKMTSIPQWRMIAH